MYFEQLRTECNKGKFVPIPAMIANRRREGMGPLLLNLNTRWEQETNTHSGHFTQGKKLPTEYNAGWTPDSQELLENRKISCPCNALSPRLHSQHPEHYTDYTITTQKPTQEKNNCAYKIIFLSHMAIFRNTVKYCFVPIFILRTVSVLNDSTYKLHATQQCNNAEETYVFTVKWGPSLFLYLNELQASKIINLHQDQYELLRM
jgi:hypothetical protein